LKAYVLGLTVLSLGVSCSSVEKISNNTMEIARTAHSSQGRFDSINEEARVTGYVDVNKIQVEASEGSKEQAYIVSLAEEVIQEIPNVEDSVPWWAGLIKWGFISTSVIGVFVILWYLGLGYPIKALMRTFSSFIPTPKKESAKLLLQAQDPNKETTYREAVAVMRATDKDFNAAYKKQTKESK